MIEQMQKRMSPVSAARWLRSGVAAHGNRFAKFGLVGASGVLVNFAAIALLVEIGGLTPVIAGILATECAILTNFLVNDQWTFRDSRSSRSWPARVWRYHGVALGGMLISVSMLATLVHLVNIHYLLANLGAIGVATLWNFSGNLRFTWSTRPSTPERIEPAPVPDDGGERARITETHKLR
jgi:dolichol-phosphate mannosyltransferase